MRSRIERRTRHAASLCGAAVLTLALLALCAAVPGALTQPARGAQPEKPKPEPAKPKLGLLVNESSAFKGYTLLAPTNSTKTYLIDMEGHVVNTWKSDVNQALSAYLLPDGHLLRTGAVKNPPFFGGGAAGRIQEFTWEGDLVWDYTYVNDKQLPSHDICKLPNGNVLMILWEKESAKDAIAAGRRPETVDNSYLLADGILEVQPTGKKTGKIVWEWHAFDHLVQDFDEKKANHGDVAAHPELIDINFGESTIAAMVAKPEELDKLRAIGYVGGANRRGQRPQADWLHVNAVTYNADFDQIMVSVFEFSEFWVIDHSTKKEEAAGHTGGKYGKGGDILFRWGNPRAYRAGTVKDQRLFGQHNAHWIPKGLPGEGHVLVFNNGMRRTGGAYSTVDEVVLPVNKKGEYEHAKGKAFGPDKAVWSYAAPKKTDFYAPFISGAQRQPNGNTLICSGTNGTLFEVTPKDEVVWKYINPSKGAPFGGAPRGGNPGGGNPFGAAPKLGEVLPLFLQGVLKLDDEQKKKLEEVEKELKGKLETLLTDEQKKKFAEGPGGFGPGSLPAPGQLLAKATEERMKLSDEQKKQLAELQKTADEKVGALLKDDQKKQLKQMQDFSKAFAGPPGGKPPFGGPPGGRGPFGGPPGFGPPGGSGLFRALRYAPDYPGLAKRDLKPGKTIEEVEANPPKDAPKEKKDK